MKKKKQTESQLFKPLISKSEFVDAITTLKDQSKRFDKLRTAMQDLCPDFYVDFYPQGIYEDIIVDLLTRFFPHATDDVDYFIYELNYGADWKRDSIRDADGTSINISTPSKLYDYLVQNEEECLKQENKEQGETTHD